MKLVSGNGISDFSVVDEEMVMTKLAAAFKKKESTDSERNYSGKQVLAHHIIQSSPDDDLTPERSS